MNVVTPLLRALFREYGRSNRVKQNSNALTKAIKHRYATDTGTYTNDNRSCESLEASHGPKQYGLSYVMSEWASDCRHMGNISMLLQ